MSQESKSRSLISAEFASMASAFSEADGISVGGTLAESRAGQSACKNWVLLAFAQRVAAGESKPHETAFMSALMAADMPSKDLREEAFDVANTVSFLSIIDELDLESALDNALAAARGGDENGD